ncbi:breast cancer metastasis-suppressor 1-like protein isoform X2 [Pomacea canaliculata]|uniref:breast cancer metastasis-suppressor 1-like protein isoform X2 n=1 Tax=Pomacea canaliculata TaxID=400727 RepID=UPI000D73D984|nr:breast cancer metastasis-suppressor 1-like protein isoform X2 [Pomacea canaliculata]
MPTVAENGKGEHEEESMDQDDVESSKSSEEETASGSGMEGEEECEEDGDESTEMDEDECDKKRAEYLDDLAELDRQFIELKDQLFNERVAQIEAKLAEVRTGTAQEYLIPLGILEQNMHHRFEVAEILRGYRREAIKRKFESEELAAYQHMQSEKILLFDSLKQELQDKIRRLEEDRNNIDIYSDLAESQSLKKRKRHDPLSPDRRKKPVTVTGPYIVYMLQEEEVIEDWTTIKKAIKQQMQRRKSEL